MIGVSKCLGFVWGTTAEHMTQKEKSLGFPDNFFLSGKDGCRREWVWKINWIDYSFPFLKAFSKPKCPGEGERYLHLERLLEGNWEDFLLFTQWDMVKLSEAHKRNLFKILSNLVSSVRRKVMVFASWKHVLVRINYLWDAETQIWRPWEAAWSIQINAGVSLGFALT